jgi:hypothetical protein
MSWWLRLTKGATEEFDVPSVLVDRYLGGACFKSQLRTTAVLTDFSWFSWVPPGKFQSSFLTEAQLVPSKFFPPQYSPVAVLIGTV